MDDAANGSLKGSKPKATINGGITSALNGHAAGPRTRRASSRPGIFARVFSIVARILTWYSILTILLRCPATLDACDDTSPRFCKPYFQLREVVSPHIQPYYDSYAAPYVELVRPYYNAVDEMVITPGWGYAKRYGAPRVEQIQTYARAQWEKNVQPQITKYQYLIRDQYDQNLGPHVNYVQTAFGPYYDIARTNALQTYHELLLPSYQYVQPYARRGYIAASAFTTRTAIPATLLVWNKTYSFLDATVWPQLKVIYVENVEPQLVKISQRLGRHNSSKKSIPKPVKEAQTGATSKTTSSFAKPSPSVSGELTPPIVSLPSSPKSSVGSSSSSSPSATPSSSTGFSRPASGTAHSIGSGTTLQPVSPPEIDEKLENEDPVRRSARETVAADLRDWQERYAKAAEESAAEISNQVQDISKKLIRRNARVTGKSLLEQLQTSIVTELVGLRRDIIRIVGSVKMTSAGREGQQSGVTSEEAQEEITRVVRKAGMAIKEKAQAVRIWREQYENEIRSAITASAETHFTILEDIRDLALQKIGMKWAWMDGITYKDWAKYHQLKAKFEEWKGELQGLIVKHPSIEAAQLEGSKIEDEAMHLAANAAKELAHLKKAGGLKLIIADDSPEFDHDVLQNAVDEAEAAKKSPETIEESGEVSGATGSAHADVGSKTVGVEAVADGAGSSQSASEDEAGPVQDIDELSVVAQTPEEPAPAPEEESLQVAGEPSQVAESTSKPAIEEDVPWPSDQAVTPFPKSGEPMNIRTEEESVSSTKPVAVVLENFDVSSVVSEPLSMSSSAGEPPATEETESPKSVSDSAAPVATGVHEADAEVKVEAGNDKDEL